MVTKLIETAIEIEGLLRIIQNGDAPEEAYALLTRKAGRLAEASEFLAKNHLPKPKAEPAAEQSKPSVEAPDPEVGETLQQEEIASDEEEMAEDASTEAYELLGELPEESDKSDDSDKSDNSDLYEKSEKSERSDCGGSDDDDILLSLDDEAAEAEEPAHAPAAATKATPAGKEKTKLKSFFSLNDRFLFSRELFGGDMKMFDSTLRQLEGIEKFSDVEEYFFEELEWDRDRSFTEEFMDILRPHFK